MGLEPFVRPFLILTHQPRIAGHIGGEDGGETAGRGHGWAGPRVERSDALTVAQPAHYDMWLAISIKKAGCGRLSRKATSSSPFVVTCSRFLYQDLRVLMRSFSGPVSRSSSPVHLTSLAVNGLP